MKDKKKAMKFEKGDFAITSDILVEILEECIRIFWRFVKADNDSSTVPVKCHKGVHPEIENADDLELLMEVQRSLQKVKRKCSSLLSTSVFISYFASRLLLLFFFWLEICRRRGSSGTH